MKKTYYILILLILLLLVGCAEEDDARPRPTVPATATATPTKAPTPTPTEVPTPTPTKAVHVKEMSFPNHSFTNYDTERNLRQLMTKPVEVKHSTVQEELSEMEKRLYAGEIVLWQPGTSVDLNGDGYQEDIQINYDTKQTPIDVSPLPPGLTRVDYCIGAVSCLYGKTEEEEYTGQVYLACLDGTETKQAYVLVEYYVKAHDTYRYDCLGYAESEGKAWIYRNRSVSLSKALPELVIIGNDRATWLMQGENGDTETIDYGVIMTESTYRLWEKKEPWWNSNIDAGKESGLFPVAVFFPEEMHLIEPEYKELSIRTNVYPDTVQKEKIYVIKEAKLTIYGKSEDGQRVFALIENMEQWNGSYYGAYHYGWFDVDDLE